MKNVYNLIPIKGAKLIELADAPDGAARFQKQLVPFGEWVDPILPDEMMVFDLAYLQAFERNFNDAVVGRIPVPLGHPFTPEDLVALNKGELVSCSVQGDGSQPTDGF